MAPKSRTERPRKTNIGTEVAHVTRDSDTTFKVKRSKVKVTRPLCSPPCWRIRQLQRWAWGRVGHGKLLLRCRLLGVARHSVPMGGEGQGHIVAAARLKLVNAPKRGCADATMQFDPLKFPASYTGSSCQILYLYIQLNQAINHRRDSLMRTPQRSRVVIRHDGLRAVIPLNRVTSKPISTFSVFKYSPSRTSRMLKSNSPHVCINSCYETDLQI